MEITIRALWTMIHGMLFGGLYLLACSGAIVELWRRYAPAAKAPVSTRDEGFFRIYLVVMAVLAWLAVFSGAYIVYPWYRALPPVGTSNLAAYPQQVLMSSPTTIAWHSIGMEWKEYVAWLAPISITMAAAIFIRYGRGIRNYPSLRNAVLSFVVASLIAAAIAGFFGAEIDARAPVWRIHHTDRSRRALMSAQDSATMKTSAAPDASATQPNGSGAAALLAAGIGSFVLAILAITADQIKPFQHLMIFWKPTGPLSGVSTSAIIAWLVAWGILEAIWKGRTVEVGRVPSLRWCCWC